MIHPRILKIITDDMISPCCGSRILYAPQGYIGNKDCDALEGEYYCSNVKCPIKLTISDPEQEYNNYRFIYFKFLYKETRLHVFVDYQNNELAL